MSASNDSDDLQALFDAVVEQKRAAMASGEGAVEPASATTHEAGGEWPAQEAVFHRVGQMARQLHNTLRELGYDKVLESTVSAIPDARDRLAYVANLTEQAACRVLNATDIAKPVVDDMAQAAEGLGQRWDKAFANELNTADFRQLAEETRAYLKRDVPDRADAVNQQLLEIMMAQDFQDLTGQVIKKIVSLAQDLEEGLMTVLLDTVPQNKRSQEVTSLMNGPVVNPDGRSDVVVNQQQVDDLLDSLGF